MSRTHRGTIAVYFPDPQYEDYPFNDEKYVRAYHEFANELFQRNGTCVIVRSMATYRGGNSFHGGWIYDGATFRRSDAVISADLIYNKGEDFVGDQHSFVINDPAFHKICEKDQTYRLLHEFMAPSVIVASKEAMPGALDQLTGPTIICKPTQGYGGIGIVVESKEKILSANLPYPFIVQEFLDLSAGIPGVIDGRHDLRMVFVGDAFTYAILRTPPPGGVLANVAQGGTLRVLDDSKIPSEAMEIGREVNRRFARFPTRVFSVDVGRSANGKWYIFELNSPPGCTPNNGNRILMRHQRMLAEHLLACAENPSKE